MNAFLWAAVTLGILGIVVPIVVEVVTHPDNWSATIQALIFSGACVAVAIVLAGIGIVAK
jgi:hypothetical protein